MFTNAVKLVTINDFDIKVDPSWLIIAALITWSLSQTFFPDTLPNQTAGMYFTMALIAMLGLFASLLLHELAHSIVARHLGVPIKGITLFLFGGVAELETEPSSASTEFWIAIAGPLTSLVLSSALWTVEQIAFLAQFPAPLVAVLSYLALINLILALFNLLPAFPLDGGRVLRAILWARSGDILSATRAASQAGAVLAYALMAIGVFALFQGAIGAGLWQLMIGAFVLMAARSSYAAQLAKVAFSGKTVESLMSRKVITANPDMTLSAFVSQIRLHKGVSFVPVTEDDVLLGYIDQSVLAGIDRENWANTHVGDVFIGLDSDAIIAPDVDAQDLLGIISGTGRRKFMVVSDHHLMGIITLSDLTHHLNTAPATPEKMRKGASAG